MCGCARRPGCRRPRLGGLIRRVAACLSIRVAAGFTERPAVHRRPVALPEGPADRWWQRYQGDLLVPWPQHAQHSLAVLSPRSGDVPSPVASKIRNRAARSMAPARSRTCSPSRGRP